MKNHIYALVALAVILSGATSEACRQPVCHNHRVCTENDKHPTCHDEQVCTGGSCGAAPTLAFAIAGSAHRATFFKSINTLLVRQDKVGRSLQANDNCRRICTAEPGSGCTGSHGVCVQCHWECN